jgi:transposase
MDEKRRVVDESLEEGASIAEIARRHDLNTNQLFTWRRQFGVVPTAPQELAPILPWVHPQSLWVFVTFCGAATN